jgi:hypothetical protein
MTWERDEHSVAVAIDRLVNDAIKYGRMRAFGLVFNAEGRWSPVNHSEQEGHVSLYANNLCGRAVWLVGLLARPAPELNADAVAKEAAALETRAATLRTIERAIREAQR